VPPPVSSQLQPLRQMVPRKCVHTMTQFVATGLQDCQAAQRSGTLSKAQTTQRTAGSAPSEAGWSGGACRPRACPRRRGPSPCMSQSRCNYTSVWYASWTAGHHVYRCNDCNACV